MQTLKVSQIFSNFSFYQTQYLQIISSPDQYYTEVDDAFIHVWPFAKQKLYLGDLLQLWLGHKFIVESKHESLFDLLSDEVGLSDVYHLYKVEGNLLTNQSSFLAWSQGKNQNQRVEISRLFKLYCLFKSISRPAHNNRNVQSCETVI